MRAETASPITVEYGPADYMYPYIRLAGQAVGTVLGNIVRDIGESADFKSGLRLASKNGEPLESLGISTKKDLLDPSIDWEEVLGFPGVKTIDQLVDYLLSVVDAGGNVATIMRVFPKVDMHSLKKIVGKKYRTIQLQDAISFLMMRKRLQKRIEAIHEQVDWDGVLAQFFPTFKSKVFAPCEKAFSSGEDYSSWDKTVSAPLMEMAIRILCEGMNENFINWVINDAVYAPYYYSDSPMYTLRIGQVPSGHYLTTILNTIVHQILTKAMWYKANGDEPMTNVVCGDDGVVYAQNPEAVLRYTATCEEQATLHGMAFKGDLYAPGVPYPPGSHPPFLATIGGYVRTKYFGQIFVTVPADPVRAFQRLPEVEMLNSTEEKIDLLRGLIDLAAGYINYPRTFGQLVQVKYMKYLADKYDPSLITSVSEKFLQVTLESRSADTDLVGSEEGLEELLFYC